MTVLSTRFPSSETINASNETETSKDYYTEYDSNQWEWGLDKSFNDYDLEETFTEPGEPTFEEKFNQMFKIGPPQNFSNPKQMIPLKREACIETFWELNDSTFFFTLF